MVIATDNFVTVNGVRLHYINYGAPGNPSLLLLHGLSGQAHNWDTLAPRFTGRYHVFALTTRGHGDSDRSPDYGPFTMVNEVTAFIDALGIAPAAVVGHSMGAMLGAGVALLHSAKVSKLVMVDAGPEGDPEGQARIDRAIRETRPEFDTAEQVMDNMRVGYLGIREDELERLAAYNTARGADGKLRLKTDPAFYAVREGGGNPEPSALWGMWVQIKSPTLVVRGTKSDVLSAEVAQRMVEVNPNARLVEIDAGHMAFLENPTGFCDAVREFLELP